MNNPVIIKPFQLNQKSVPLVVDYLSPNDANDLTKQIIQLKLTEVHCY